MDATAPLALVPVIAFAAEYVDSSLGMGYGTTLVPILICLGFSPGALVPAVLLSELVTGLFAAVMHHRAGNVRFDFGPDRDHPAAMRLGKLWYVPRSIDSRIAITLSLCSLVGATASVVIAVRIPTAWASLAIGVVVLLMGLLVILRRSRASRFSWRRIIALGVAAAFNKGLSGGGYGPLVTSGQILAGVESRNSVAITSLSESFTCLVGLLAYIALSPGVDWKTVPLLLVGAVLAVPCAILTVRRVPRKGMMAAVGVATVCLGILTIYKAVNSF